MKFFCGVSDFFAKAPGPKNQRFDQFQTENHSGLCDLVHKNGQKMSREAVLLGKSFRQNSNGAQKARLFGGDFEKKPKKRLAQ